MRINGIDYSIIRESDVPNHPGRKMLHLKRQAGATKYVAIRYEDGSLSSVQKNPF